MAEHQDAGLQDLQGQSEGEPGMKTCSNMIRVFISSTFTDMSSERKALLEKAYPEVLSFCRSLGFVFEVVDLRWGIRNIMSGHHDSWEIFVKEIENCRRISAGPAFVALLGNRYGHRALPQFIPEKEFEVLSSKLTKNPEGVKQLNQWFLKDDNAVPPTHVLQPITAHFPHYNDLRPESRPQHDKDVVSWRLTETQLLQLLRTAVTAAEKDGDVTSEQKKRFFSSVTEREFEQGLWEDDSRRSALLFVREVQKQRVREGPKRLAKYMDVTFDGLLDAEAQGLLTELKSRLYTSSKDILNLHCVELVKGGVDPKRKEHAQYLESVCEQFVSQMKARITAVVQPQAEGGEGERRVWGSTEGRFQTSATLEEEVRQQVARTTELCKGLQGRETLLGKLCLTMWESNNVHHGPLVVHSPAGMGKTTLLCKLAHEMQKVLGARSAVVIRLLSAHHPQRPDINQVLHSVCLQVCLCCGLSPPSPLTAGAHLELLRFFRTMLSQASQQGYTLLLILDSLDQLSDQDHAHRLHWFPVDLPPNIHIVVSMDTSSEVFANIRLKVENLERFFMVERLSGDDGKKIMETNMRSWQRTLTPEQSQAVLQRFEVTGCPLHLKLMLSAAKHWSSFTPLSELTLGENLKETFSKLLLKLEGKHGKELVGGALGYLALARQGLLEAELRDVLSLDDNVISEVYKYFLPPTPSLIRLPPFLWARLRRDLEDLLEERWTSGVVFIAFNNRHVAEMVSSHYLTPERRARSHKILADYFLGRWSGKLKPAALPGLSLLLSDRKVPPQPLWFAPGMANVRKLQEMPYHLLHADQWEELQQQVIGSVDWLYCKSRVCGVSAVIQDLDLCTQFMNCTETRLIRDTLVLCKPTFDFLEGEMDMNVFCAELLARLSSLAQKCPAVIGQLCSQCEEWLLTCPEPILLPKCSFMQQPGGALQHTLYGLHGGVVCLDVSLQLQVLVAGSDDGVVGVWSLVDQQLLHTLLGHRDAVLHVQVIDSSTGCLSLAADGCLMRWNLINGQQLLCIQEAVPVDSTPSAVHLQLLDQNQLICVYTSTQVKLWKLDGAQLFSSTNEEDSVTVGVLEDSVFSLTRFGLVRIWSLLKRTPTVETELRSSKRSITVINSTLAPKRGKVIVVSKDGFLFQISRQGNVSAVDFPLVPSLLSVTEDEKILMAGSDLTLRLFNLDTDSLDNFLNLTHNDIVLSACLSSDGRQLFSGAADQLIRIWSMTTGALLDSLCGSHSPVSSLLLYKGFVVSASAAAACVQMWNLKYDPDFKPIDHIPVGCAHVAITKDCDHIFFVREQSEMEVVSWNNHTGCISERLSVSAEVSCLEIAQNKRLLFCGLTSGTVLIYPLNIPQETLCIPPPESLCSVLSLAVNSKERHVAVAYEDAVCLYEITTRDSFPTVEGPLHRSTLSLLQSPLSSMALLPDRRLLYGTSGGEVTLHDLRDGGSSALEPHHSRITCVTASNWGTHALVGSEDAVQRLWSLSPVALDHTMEYKGFFFEGVLCAAFADSDQFVFTGSKDRTVKVWDVVHGNLLLVQYVYAPVVRMLTHRNGFVALSQQGCVIREVFRCPEHVSPDYNPLRNVKAHYRVTSRERSEEEERARQSELQNFNPAQFNLALMLNEKPSATCILL